MIIRVKEAFFLHHSNSRNAYFDFLVLDDIFVRAVRVEKYVFVGHHMARKFESTPTLTRKLTLTFSHAVNTTALMRK